MPASVPGLANEPASQPAIAARALLKVREKHAATPQAHAPFIHTQIEILQPALKRNIDFNTPIAPRECVARRLPNHRSRHLADSRGADAPVNGRNRMGLSRNKCQNTFRTLREAPVNNICSIMFPICRVAY